ncbi:hypothetical protein C8R43DRAFT_1132103 [Mycena crocata]|nr:hypothetical protein C8R43DRAFT_1132103 [Mycena crocata]
MLPPLPGWEPLLPPELEQKILEISALSDSAVIPQLILVAHRVRIWIEPLLYRIISLDPCPSKNNILEHVFLKALESKPATFWQDHTNTYPWGNTSDLALFHVDYRFQWARFLPQMVTMPLCRLSTDLGELFRPVGLDFDHPVFAHLIHLTLLDISPGSKWAVGLGRLPCLTHVSFDFPRSPYPNGSFESFLRDIFARCNLLEVLVFRTKVKSLRGWLKHYTYFADEPRAVVFGLDDFLRDC